MKFMSGRVLAFAAVFIQVFSLAGSRSSAQQYQHGAQRLMGVWQCVCAAGQKTTLVIDKENFNFNGDQSAYAMVPGAIRVQGAYGPVNYYYNFRGESLLVAFPDGTRIICEKTQQEAQNH